MQPPLTWGDRRPVEPPPSAWALPSPLLADVNGLVGVGADLEPGTFDIGRHYLCRDRWFTPIM